MKKLILVMVLSIVAGASLCFADAKPALTPNGVTIEAAGSAFVLNISDGTKVFFYGDYGTSRDLYAERVDVNGNSLWFRSIAAEDNDQQSPWACETSDGEIIVAWEDERFGSTREDIFAAKIKKLEGSKIWVTQVTSVQATIHDPRVCADENGGAYITFSQGGMGDYLIAQHLRYDVGFQWLADVPIDYYMTKQPYNLISAPHNQAVVMYTTEEGKVSVRMKLLTSEAIADVDSHGRLVQTRQRAGSHGDVVRNGNYINLAYMQDPQTGTGDDIYVSKYDDYLNYLGTLRLTSDTADQRYPRVIADSQGSAYVGWADFRNYAQGQGNDLDIYMQKANNMGSSGTPASAWTANGVLVTHAQGVKAYFIVQDQDVPDVYIIQYPMAYNNGRVYVTWHDFRRQPSVAWYAKLVLSHRPDIFAQSLDAGTGAPLANDIPVCSLNSLEVFAAVYTSDPFIPFLDARSGTHWDVMAQKLEEGDTTITNIVTTPANTSMRIVGSSFGTDPSCYADQNFTINTNYNNVTANGTTVPATAWSTDEITVNLTYDSLSPGAYNFVVTAYGDASNSFSLVKPSGDISIQDVKFDGVDYSDGMAVKSSTTITGQIISNYDVQSATIAIDGGTETGLDLDANNKFSYDISGLSADSHSIVIKVTDVLGTEDTFTYNVSVSSAISFDEIYFVSPFFGERRYTNEYNAENGIVAYLSDTLKVKVESDYAIEEFKIGSSGVEINVMSYYSNGYLNAPLRHIGNFSGLSKITLRAKDENDNEISKDVYFDIGTGNTIEIKENSIAHQNATADQDAVLTFNAYVPEPAGGATATAAATTARVRIILYSPTGSPLRLEHNVTAGYNEVTIPRGMFDSNGLYIVKIYDENNQHLATTRVLVYLGK